MRGSDRWQEFRLARRGGPQGAPCPAPVPPAPPPPCWHRVGQGKGFYFCEGTQALAPHATPVLGPARQGEGTAVSIYLTLAAVAGKALGAEHHLVPRGQPEGPRGLWRERGGRSGGPLTGRKPATSPLSRRRPRSALSGLHGPGRGEQGTSLGLSHPPSALSPATGLSCHPPPRGSMGTPASLCRRPGPAQPPCACSRVCVSVCVCCCVVKLCPSPSPNQRVATEATVMQLSVCVRTASLLFGPDNFILVKTPQESKKLPSDMQRFYFFGLRIYGNSGH